MLIEIKEISGNIATIEIIKQTGEFPEKIPEPGEYTVYFETVTPDPVPEFNL